MKTAIKFGMSVREFYDCTPNEIQLFISARKELWDFKLEQGWDYVRNIGRFSLMAFSGNSIEPHKLIPLKRDNIQVVELTEDEKEELKNWEDECDNEMIEDGMKLIPMKEALKLATK